MKPLSKMMTFAVALAMLLSISSVTATWLYSDSKVNTLFEELPLSVFPWTGSEALPDEDGVDHGWLINNLINGENIGLNTSGSYLNQQIKDRWETSFWDSTPQRDTLGSMAVLNAERLEELFGAKAANLSYLIQMVDEDDNGDYDFYYIFTTDVDLGERGQSAWSWGTLKNTVPGKPSIPIGQNIYPIYRTKVEKDSRGIWTATDSKLGYAKSAWYDENQSNASKNATQIPAFNPNSWQEHTDGNSLGTRIDTPIWTYAGYENNILLASNTSKAYYAFSPLTAATYTVTSDSASASFKVYDASQNVIATSASGGTLTWTAAASATYYIEVSGDTKISFTIS